MKAVLHAVGAARSRPTSRSGDECELFERAWRHRLPLLLKGPTGCGKTRFVAHMAARLGLPLHTVACHDDLTAADLTGRYLLKGGETVWVDGPLTRAVREGGICYLDEVVEARKDVTVVLHPLTDDRRILPLERTGEVLVAPPRLHARRLLQPRLPEHPQGAEALTRQRFVAIEFDFLRPSRRSRWSPPRAALRAERVRPLMPRRPAARAQGTGPRGGRLDPAAGLLRDPDRRGHPAADAALAGMIEPLSDDPDVKAALLEVARAVIG